MNFDLDSMIDQAVSALPRGNRAGSKAAPSFLREITKEDLPEILSRPAAPPAERPMLRIRHQHHLAAKMIAESKAPAEVSLITGYSIARLNQLKKDPAFAELVTHYQAQTDEKWLNVHERLATLGITVTEEIMERLEASPEEFSNEELRRLAETLLDRGGYGPASSRKVTVESRNLTLTLVEQIKAESEGRGRVSNLLEHIDE